MDREERDMESISDVLDMYDALDEMINRLPLVEIREEQRQREADCEEILINYIFMNRHTVRIAVEAVIAVEGDVRDGVYHV